MENKQPASVVLSLRCRFFFHEQVVRHVLARHDPLRCSGPAKPNQHREGHDGSRAVRFRGNELLGLVAVGGGEVRSVAIKPGRIERKQRDTANSCRNVITSNVVIGRCLQYHGVRGAGHQYWKKITPCTATTKAVGCLAKAIAPRKCAASGLQTAIVSRGYTARCLQTVTCLDSPTQLIAMAISDSCAGCEQNVSVILFCSAVLGNRSIVPV